ncbi:MAG: pentapeptide repeat-containing protein, partial [Rubrobacter sp.]|nr:pentapeptide repeat-containing protein [Rubrobacter sp.]
MADEAQLNILKQQGVTAWNKWREENLDVRPDLQQANLSGADLYQANLSGADLVGCSIYGISAWDLKLSNETNQSNLTIRSTTNDELKVDDIEIAQFVYLLRTNKRSQQIEKIRKVFAHLGIEAEDIAKQIARMPDAFSPNPEIDRVEKVEDMVEPNGPPQPEAAKKQASVSEGTATPSQNDVMLARDGFWIVLVGMGIVAVLFLALMIDIAAMASMGYDARSADMAAMLSSVTAVIG